jgi:ribose 1,5-bisphosphokinase PhnN
MESAGSTEAHGAVVRLHFHQRPTALLLAIRSTAHKLVWMITTRLIDLLAVAAVAITHQAAPNRDASRLL